MMEITEENVQGSVVLHLSGRLDTTTSPDLESTFNRLIDQGQKKLLIDLQNLEYISSSGLRVFLGASKRLKPLQGRFLLCHLSNLVSDVIKMAGFDQILEIFPSQEEALKTL